MIKSKAVHTFQTTREKTAGLFIAMIAKTTLCLIVITTTCQTALHMQEVITVIVVNTPTTVTSCNQLARLSALIIHLSRRVYNASFENLEEAQRGTDKKHEYSNSEIVFKYSNGIRIFEYSNIR